MKKKKCSRCNVKKQLSEFNKKKTNRDGYQGLCRKCSNKYSKRHYYANKEYYLNKARKRNDTVGKDNQKNIIELLKKSECADCGNNNPMVLEFDHVRGKKKNNISNMVKSYYSWRSISDEINKCDIVCANCHKIRTHAQQRTYKYNALTS